jgi:EXS family
MSSTQEVGPIFGAGAGVAHSMLRSPTVLIAAIGLWGMNLYFFRLFNIDYVKILHHDMIKLQMEEEDRHYKNATSMKNSGSFCCSSSNTNRKVDDSERNTLLNDESIRSTDDDSDDFCDSKNVIDSNTDDDNDVEFVKLSDYNANSCTISHRRVESKENTASGSVLSSSNKGHLSSPPIGKKSTINSSSIVLSKMPSSVSGTVTSSSRAVGPPVRSYSSSDAQPLPISAYDQDSDLVDIEVADHAATGTGALLLHDNNNNSTHSNASDKTSIVKQKLHQQQQQNDSITWFRLAALSMSLLFVLHTTYYVWIHLLNQETISAVFCFYTAVAVVFIVPLKATSWLRKAGRIVIERILELVTIRFWCCRINEQSVKRPFGPRAVPFVDVFFADAMCSLSKVFFDWGMLLHMAYYFPNPVPISSYNILIPSAFASVPYLIRARQCLVMYSITSIKNDPGRNQHLWNALKYSTSLFPLILSAYKQTIGKNAGDQLEIVLIILLVVNASYSLFWDIVMDWGMMKTPTAAISTSGILCTGKSPTTMIVHPPNSTGGGSNTSSFSKSIPTPPTSMSSLNSSNGNIIEKHGTINSSNRPKSCWYLLLRQRLRFGVAMSLIILLSDTCLRFSWTLRFVFPDHNNDRFVLMTQFLEIFRRAIWNLLRVEWEHIKQTTANHQSASGPVVLSSSSSSVTTATTGISSSGASACSSSSGSSSSTGTLTTTATTSSSGKPYSNLVSRYNSNGTNSGNNSNANNINNGTTNILQLSSIDANNNINMKDDDDEKAKLLVLPRVHNSSKIKP